MKINLRGLFRKLLYDLLVVLLSLILSLSMYDYFISSNAVNITSQKSVFDKSLQQAISPATEISNRSNAESDDEGIKTIVAIFGPIIAGTSAAVAYLTYRYQKRMAFETHHYQRKQYEFNALVQLFNLLSNEKHISAREAVREAYAKYALVGKAEKAKKVRDFDQPGVKEQVELVKADFDQIGALVKNNLIDKQTVLDSYGLDIVNYWKYLEDHINHMINETKDSKYMINFRLIADDAKKFYPDDHTNDPNAS